MSRLNTNPNFMPENVQSVRQSTSTNVHVKRTKRATLLNCIALMYLNYREHIVNMCISDFISGN